ncbi:MAG: hypothetical protein [Inoviridae sp.]|nr:MAG: hypothetical protein [Inoviridae sp.]
MKSELKTLDVIDSLRNLHQHYIRLINISKDKGDSDKALIHSYHAEGVKNAIHEIELMSHVIHGDK